MIIHHKQQDCLYSNVQISLHSRTLSFPDLRVPSRSSLSLPGLYPSPHTRPGFLSLSSSSRPFRLPSLPLTYIPTPPDLFLSLPTNSHPSPHPSPSIISHPYYQIVHSSLRGRSLSVSILSRLRLLCIFCTCPYSAPLLPTHPKYNMATDRHFKF